MSKEWYGRIQHKYDTEENWKKAINFVPLIGELIIYGKDSNFSYDRFKVGDGATPVNDLLFTDEASIIASLRILHNDQYLSDIIDTYILSVDYSLLAFDTSELLFDESAGGTSPILGQGILGKLILGGSA